LLEHVALKSSFKVAPVVENSKSSCDEPPQLRPGAVGRSGLIEIIVVGGNRIRVCASFDAGALARVLEYTSSASV